MAEKKARKLKDLDFSLLTLVLVLMAIGLLMVFSASSYYAMYRFGDKYMFVAKQAVFVVFGVFLMLVVSRVDYHFVGKISPALAMLGIVLLGIVLIPGIGWVSNDARRWFNLGFTTVQPSEFMKIALILVLSFSLSQRHNKLKSLWSGLVPYLVMVGIIDAELYFEPHMSGIVIITLISLILLMAAGARFWHFLVVSVPAAFIVGGLMLMEGYRLDRIMTFIGKNNDPTGDAYQITNSLIAIGSGSLFGRGLGQSLQKNLYIPEPQSDFIFAVLAEELGFIGAVTVLLLFVLLIIRGMRVAMNAPDMLGGLMGVGITSLFAIEVMLNIAVVTKSIPTTGIPLPFFSSGGTSLLFMSVAMGILLNISRQTIPVFRAGAVPDPERRSPAGRPPVREAPVKLAPGPSGRTRR
jgi:cell division protein FtsW